MTHYVVLHTSHGRPVLYEYTDIERALMHANITGGRLMTLYDVVQSYSPAEIERSLVLRSEQP